MALITEAMQRGIAPMMAHKMKNFAEFQILGRVGKIKQFDGKVNVNGLRELSDQEGQRDARKSALE